MVQSREMTSGIVKGKNMAKISVRFEACSESTTIRVDSAIMLDFDWKCLLARSENRLFSYWLTQCFVVFPLNSLQETPSRTRRESGEFSCLFSSLPKSIRCDFIYCCSLLLPISPTLLFWLFHFIIFRTNSARTHSLGLFSFL